MTTVPPRRLTSAQRRDSIVDAAIDLLRERGAGSVTMERIAERAGVSKALPYRHFANAEAVLVEVLARYERLLGGRVLAAVEAAGDSLEERLAAATTAYFDVVLEHGAVMVLLQASPSVDEAAARVVAASEFVERLFVGSFGVPPQAVPGVADLVVATLAASATSWERGRGRRKDLEALAVAASCGAIEHARRQSPTAARRNGR